MKLYFFSDLRNSSGKIQLLGIYYDYVNFFIIYSNVKNYLEYPFTFLEDYFCHICKFPLLNIGSKEQ